MKKTRLLEIIREEIVSVLTEKTALGPGSMSDPDFQKAFNKLPGDEKEKVKKGLQTGSETFVFEKGKLGEDQLNEMAKIDTVLNTAMSNAIEKYIEDKGLNMDEITALVKELKPIINDKEAAKKFFQEDGKLLATTMKDIRQLFTGDPTNPKNANRQDPEVNKLMIDREDELIDNQTNKYILNYFGWEKGQKGRKPGEKPTTPTETPTAKTTSPPTKKEPEVKSSKLADDKDSLLDAKAEIETKMRELAQKRKTAPEKDQKKLLDDLKALNVEKGEIDKKIAKL
jgi:hypothetical protein